MSARPVARAARPAIPGEPAPWDLVTLDHDGRTLRREVVETVHGEKVLVDLPEATTLGHGDRLVLGDGRTLEVIAAEEDLAEVRGADALHLMRLAWHLGNRHLPTQIEEGRLLIRRDPVIERMLAGQGATVAAVSEPFHPEGGAYAVGHGHAAEQAGTHGHAHGQAHRHGGGHDHDHDHDHDHGHGGHRHG